MSAGLSAPIRLIVGLGNPGDEYVDTRHNAGFWVAEKIAQHYQSPFRRESKFKGLVSQFLYQAEKRYILIPTTFMNHSGQSVKLLCDFYKIAPENIVILHDELDLPCGDLRLKFSGGHGGQNGLRDIIGHLGTPDFWRVRIGVAHPGVRDDVVDYVLSRPSREEQKKIDESLERFCSVIEYLLTGQNEKAMQLLHTK